MEYRVRIESMHCEQCASSIERYLHDRPGVTTAEVDFETGTARLEVTADADVTALVASMESIGYDATLLERSS